MLTVLRLKKSSKALVSLLLVFSIMASLFVPFPVFAEQAAAENDEIYAILYYIDPSIRSSDNTTISNGKNIELVFQKGDTLDAAKTVVTDKSGNRGVFSLANDPTTYTSNNAPVTPWYGFNSTSSNQNIVKVDFKDKIKPASIAGWFRNCRNLAYEDILHKENLDTSVCESMSYTFQSCNQFATFDFSEWTELDFSSVKSMKYMFGDCTGLHTIDLTGVDPVNCTDCSYMFYRNTALRSVKFGTFRAGNEARKATGATADGVSLQRFFSGCTNLETIDTSEIELNFPNSTSYMFDNCTSLLAVDFSRIYGRTPLEGFATNMTHMFNNCTSLEVVNFNLFPHTLGYAHIENIFKGCVSLREFYLEDAKKTSAQYNSNIFSDSPNLSLIAITPNWLANTGWVPEKTQWTKVKMAKVSQSGEVGVGTVLDNIELFKNFQRKYAGTWVAEADFEFNGVGGKTVVNGEETEIQFASGALHHPLDYADVIQTPVKVGYTFAGWHKSMDDDSPFASGDIAEQWTYYAHWTDNTYKLILNANSGTIPNSSETRIEYENIKYSELKKLDKDAFVHDDGKILVGWNTAANGSGHAYAPDDSVSKLTPTDGGEVTLYAIWYAPDAIVSFDPQGGSAVADRHYDLPDDYGALSDSQRTNYTFLGWYTEPEGGELVHEFTPVTGTCTLYAHWESNPAVVFDAGAGYFDEDPTKKTISKYYRYNSFLGVMPTPENGTASFLGWYDAAGGSYVGSDTEVTSDMTLTAHWGYMPVFDADAGIMKNIPNTEAQENPLYTLTSLPTVTKENSTLLGWKHGDVWVWQAGQPFPQNGVVVDLSGNNRIKAVWQQRPSCTVTLDPNGGSLKTGEINPIKVFENAPIAALPTPVREGYDFDGWYLGDVKQSIESTYSEDVTLTAHWTEKTVTLTFYPEGGTMDDGNTVSKRVTVAAGKTVPSIPGATITSGTAGADKTFGGWYTQKDGKGIKLTGNTVINGDQAFYAYWVNNKVKDDRYKYSYYAQWNTPSDNKVTDIGDRLVYHPLNGADLSAGIKVYFQTEGTAEPVPVGGLKIKVPKYIFTDWSNKPITNNNAEDVISANFELDKTSDPDYYIYVNTAPLTGTDTVYTIDYKFSPLNVNGGYIDENGYYHGGFKNEDIKVKIEVDMDGDGVLETDYTKELATEVHTKVDTTVSKFRSDISLTWQSKWGAVPADAEDYFYVIWTLNSNHAYQNYSQNFYLLWDENTVRENGTVVYADSVVTHGDTAGKYTGLQWNGSKNYTVVTKHRRDEARLEGGDQWATVSNEAILNVKWRSGYIEQFRTSATTTAYIPPVGTGLYSFDKNVPNMGENESHFKHGGQELLTNREEEHMPKLPYEISYTEGGNSDHPTWNATTGKYTAPMRTMTLIDGDRGDVVISSNNGIYSTDSWSGSETLDDGDYYFDSLKIKITEFDASKMGDEWSNPYEHTILTDYGHTQIYVRTANSDSYVLHKDQIITSSETTVALPANTVGYKIVHESEFFATNLSVKTNLCLKPTNNLATRAENDIAGKNKTLIKNRAELGVVCDENTRSYSSDKSTWPCTYVLDLSSTKLYARKHCASEKKVVIDAATMSEVEPVVISGWSYNNSGNKKRFTDGEFYDLLPKDVSVDKNSVYVKPILENWDEKTYESKKISADNYDDEILSGTLSKSSYRVSFENDWMGSGRTMMIVKVDVPNSIVATGVHVYFKLRTLYASIYNNTTTQMNMAAFRDETESLIDPEDRVSKLEDNAIDPGFKYCFADIDGNNTAFASDNTNFRLPPIHESGIDSTVRAEETSAKHQVVPLNTDYTYYISYGSGLSSITEDLVFYDVIEHRLDGLQSEWQGHFRGVDVSTIASAVNDLDPEATCAPVVWYAVSTGEHAKPKDSFVFDSDTEDDDFNLSKNTFWTTVPPENLDEVTAIAVDCRTDSKGNPFRLKPESTVGFNINMHSIKEPDRNNIYAYNEAIIRFTLANVNTRVTQHTQTDVLLHFNTPTFEKTAFPSSGSDNNHPAVVVKNSVLEYTLKITNPDTEVPMTNIVITDTLNASLVRVNDSNIRVKLGDGAEVNISKSVHIDSYEIKLVDGYYHFRAVVGALEMGETISIILPVTVAGEKNEKINNTAQIASVNGSEFNISSNTNYHIIDDPQVKVFKVNSKDEPLPGATLKILNDDAEQTSAVMYDREGNLVTDAAFTTGSEVVSFSIQPGVYILREISTPDNAVYKMADDIRFRIDSEGFAYVNGEKTDIIKMVDEPRYKVVFHENNPEIDDKNVIFRIYEPIDLDSNKRITHFYDIPKWAGDEYVFAGWYHNTGYTESVVGIDYASNFESDAYTERDSDYHLYAKWIKVGTVSKDSQDANIIGGNYRGFGLAGVQIRDPYMYDTNYNQNLEDQNDRTPGGMRFVTSLKESLLQSIDALSSKTISTEEGVVNVEYGYAVGTEANINTFIAHYGITDTTNYKLQYKGENVNGVNTNPVKGAGTAETDFRYITNINCTRGTTNSMGTIKDDHRNFTDYRLYTLVVTYEGDSASNKNDKIDARAYIRYYDANGKLRVFYNNYNKSMYYGGCMCSYNQVAGMAIPRAEEG